MMSPLMNDALFTDPQEAKIFVEETGVDALAVAIGTRTVFIRVSQN